MTTQQWTVVGAGPSGILAVAKLIDSGIAPKTITWIDPKFEVGDLNAKWSEVPSNTIVKLFIDYLKEMQCIDMNTLSDCNLFKLNEQDTCFLSEMVTPLQQCSDVLTTKVNSLSGTVTKLNLSDRQWHIKTANETLTSYNVILANGAHPTKLKLKANVEMLPLEIALSPSKLKQAITPSDTVGVFGSSHSAILVLKNLIDLNVKSVINFYLNPCLYALKMDDWTLFDNTGLKGLAAAWAKENIDGKLPPNLQRVISHEGNINHHLPKCTKVITATGFHADDSIQIEGCSSRDYQPQTGIIAPGLFGLGIAYPEQQTNTFGITETKVGLWKFATYFRKVLPIWLKYTT